MELSIEDYKFLALANTVATEEFAASFYDDVGDGARNALLQEFKAAGSPGDKRQWLRERLASIFVCYEARPTWVEVAPLWPFMNGRAMTFIDQLPVGETPVSSTTLAPNTVLFLFGIRVPVEGGWEMRYRVVEHHLSLANVGREHRPNWR